MTRRDREFGRRRLRGRGLNGGRRGSSLLGGQQDRTGDQANDEGGAHEGLLGKPGHIRLSSAGGRGIRHRGVCRRIIVRLRIVRGARCGGVAEWSMAAVLKTAVPPHLR